jgi:hypothetical protein
MENNSEEKKQIPQIPLTRIVLVVLFVLAVLFVISKIVSNQSPIEMMTENAVNEIKKELLDPKSFELITTKVDTIHYSARLGKEALLIIPKITNCSLKAGELIYGAKIDQIWERYDLSGPKLAKAKVYLDSAKYYEKSSKEILDFAKSIEGTEKDSIIGFFVDVRYYAVNRGGNRAIGENRYIQWNNGKTELQEISDDTEL